METAVKISRWGELLRARFASGRSVVAGVEYGERALRFASPSALVDASGWSVATVKLSDGEESASNGERARWKHDVAAGGIRGRAAVCAICSPEVDIFPVSVRAADEPDRVEALVVEEAAKHLGDRIGDVVLDYSVLPDSLRRPGERSVAALVFAVARNTAESLIDQLSAVGLDVDRLLTPACALAPLVVADHDGSRHVVIATTDTATSVAVIQSGNVLLERILPWGVRPLTARLMKELDLDERQCRKLLIRGTPRTGDLGGNRHPLRRVLEFDFEELARETLGCLSYCNSVFRHNPPSSAVIAGPLAHCGPLMSFLESRLEVTVSESTDGLELRHHGIPAPPEYAVAACCAVWPERSSG